MLILPGPGDIEIRLPPGSLEVPLERTPSGHLVMAIDQYGIVRAEAGCVPEPSIQLHAVGVSDVTSLAVGGGRHGADGRCGKCAP